MAASASGCVATQTPAMTASSTNAAIPDRPPADPVDRHRQRDGHERRDVAPATARASRRSPTAPARRACDRRVTISGSGAAERITRQVGRRRLVEADQLVGLRARCGGAAWSARRGAAHAGTVHQLVGVQVHVAQHAIREGAAGLVCPGRRHELPGSVDGIVTGEGVVLDSYAASVASRLLAALLDLVVLAAVVFVGALVDGRRRRCDGVRGRRPERRRSSSSSRSRSCCPTRSTR